MTFTDFLIMIVVLGTMFNAVTIVRLNSQDVAIAQYLVDTDKNVTERIREIAEWN